MYVDVILSICQGYRSDNFIVGLTNVSPVVTAPTLWNYALCGQYPSAVGEGETVNLQCACGLSPYRYLIVQFPSIVDGYANFCELEVYIRRKFHYPHRIINYLSHCMGQIITSLAYVCLSSLLRYRFLFYFFIFIPC